jgi:hypothetical protein
MDDRRFDALVKKVSGEAFRRELGRRGVLGGTVGGVLASVAGQAGESSLAKKKGKKKKKSKGEGICGKQCGTLCESQLALLSCNFSNPSCVCLKSTSGEIHCADAGIGCPMSPAVDQCQRDSDCGQNAICIKTSGGLCCTQPGDAQVNLCVQKCLNLTTASVESGGASSSLMAGVRKQILGR